MPTSAPSFLHLSIFSSLAALIHFYIGFIATQMRTNWGDTARYMLIHTNRQQLEFHCKKSWLRWSRNKSPNWWMWGHEVTCWTKHFTPFSFCKLNCKRSNPTSSTLYLLFQNFVWCWLRTIYARIDFAWGILLNNTPLGFSSLCEYKELLMKGLENMLSHLNSIYSL